MNLKELNLLSLYARTYPDNSSAHILGYVSQISEKDLKTKEYLQELAVPVWQLEKLALKEN